MGKTGRAHIFHTLGERGLALVRSTLYSYFASKAMVILLPQVSYPANFTEQSAWKKAAIVQLRGTP